MMRFILAFCASVLTAVYWWIVFTIVYVDVLFAGDRGPNAAPPSEPDATLRTAAVMAVSVAIYALFLMLWGRLHRRR